MRMPSFEGNLLTQRHHSYLNTDVREQIKLSGSKISRHQLLESFIFSDLPRTQLIETIQYAEPISSVVCVFAVNHNLLDGDLQFLHQATLEILCAGMVAPPSQR